MNRNKNRLFFVYKLIKKRLGRILILILGFALTFCLALAHNNQWLRQTVSAQSLRPEFVAERIYENIPDLPQENQYIRVDTGEVASDNTLVSRLIRYHQDVQRRVPWFRLDWKLTLADYLGVHQPIREERYPGASTLTKNPMEADLKVVRGLNRRQRDELITLLATIYYSQLRSPSQPASEVSPDPESPESPPPVPSQVSPSTPQLSEPGDADLLKSWHNAPATAKADKSNLR